MATLQKLTACLWFDKEAEEAARFYTSVFKNSETGRISRYGKEGFEIHGGKEGSVLTVEFTIEGQEFLALNGGPVFKFSEAISFIINCKDQEEIDYYWNKLSAGGNAEAQQCGWLKDKFGLSWQVVPDFMGELMADPDQAKVDRVMKEVLQMKKIEIAPLLKAAGKDVTHA